MLLSFFPKISRSQPSRTTRAPCLARRTEFISGVFEQESEHGELRPQDAQQDAAFLEFPDVAASEDRTAGWCTRRRRREGIVEQDTLTSDAVKGRGLGCGVTVGTACIAD